MSYNVVRNASLSRMMFWVCFSFVCLPFWAISEQAFPLLFDTGESLQSSRRTLYQFKTFDSHLKPTACLGFSGNASSQ